MPSAWHNNNNIIGSLLFCWLVLKVATVTAWVNPAATTVKNQPKQMLIQQRRTFPTLMETTRINTLLFATTKNDDCSCHDVDFVVRNSSSRRKYLLHTALSIVPVAVATLILSGDLAYALEEGSGSSSSSGGSGSGSSGSGSSSSSLDDFGERLKNNSKDMNKMRWPDSPSPLPTQFQSAEELTRTTNGLGTTTPTTSDLDQVLQNSFQRKAINPLTHG